MPRKCGLLLKKMTRLLAQQGIRQAKPENLLTGILKWQDGSNSGKGIQELIAAQSDQQWRAARQMASGRLAAHIEEMRASLLRAIAYVNAQIDFPEEGDVAQHGEQLYRPMVKDCLQRCETLIASYASDKWRHRGRR